MLSMRLLPFSSFVIINLPVCFSQDEDTLCETPVSWSPLITYKYDGSNQWGYLTGHNHLGRQEWIQPFLAFLRKPIGTRCDRDCLPAADRLHHFTQWRYKILPIRTYHVLDSHTNHQQVHRGCHGFDNHPVLEGLNQGDRPQITH